MKFHVKQKTYYCRLFFLLADMLYLRAIYRRSKIERYVLPQSHLIEQLTFICIKIISLPATCISSKSYVGDYLIEYMRQSHALSFSSFNRTCKYHNCIKSLLCIPVIFNISSICIVG